MNAKTIKKTGIIPQTLEEQWRMAKAFFRGGMIPKGINSVEAVFTAMQAGGEIGLSPFQAVQSIAVINGRPSLWGDAIPALVYASGNAEKLIEEPIFDPEAKDYIEHPDGKLIGYRCTGMRYDNKKELSHAFTIADAKRAKLWGKVSRSGAPSPWVLYPQRMLQMRARSWVCRDVWPDVLKGIAVAEEQMDAKEIIATLEGVIKSGQKIQAPVPEEITLDDISTELDKPEETEPEPEKTAQEQQQEIIEEIETEAQGSLI